MPFYRYECRNCGYEFRHLHVNGAEDSVTCPKCGGIDLERRLPRVAVQFKGSGYYKTDRADKTSKAGTRAANHRDAVSDGPTSSPKDSTKSESRESSKDV